MQNLSDIDNSMDNNTNIDEYYLLLDQINETADNIILKKHFDTTLEESKLLSFTLMPMLIVSLLLGHVIRDVGINLELGQIWTRKQIFDILFVFVKVGFLIFNNSQLVRIWEINIYFRLHKCKEITFEKQLLISI